MRFVTIGRRRAAEKRDQNSKSVSTGKKNCAILNLYDPMIPGTSGDARFEISARPGKGASPRDLAAEALPPLEIAGPICYHEETQADRHRYGGRIEERAAAAYRKRLFTEGSRKGRR